MPSVRWLRTKRANSVRGNYTLNTKRTQPPSSATWFRRWYRLSLIPGTGADYDKFYSRFKNAQTPQEETRYLFALGAFRQPDLIDRTLQMTISGEVRTQNAPYLMRGILLNEERKSKGVVLYESNIGNEMLNKYPDNSIPRMCEGIIGLVTPELEADVREFFSRHPVKQGRSNWNSTWKDCTSP